MKKITSPLVYWSLTIAATIAFYSLWIHITSNSSSAKKSPTNQAPTKEALVDLGGIFVDLPSEFVRDIEFDGDQGWSKNSSSQIHNPVKRVRSFGFYVKYPEMTTRDTDNNASLRKNWISIGLNSGENYPGGNFMNIRFQEITKGNKINALKNYERQSNGEYDLTLYTVIGVDSKTNIPYRDHEDAEDIYINTTESGDVTTEIVCSNRQAKFQPCRQHFNLEPKAKAWISVSYHRGLLLEWRNIQQEVRQLILSFEKTPK